MSSSVSSPFRMFHLKRAGVGKQSCQSGAERHQELGDENGQKGEDSGSIIAN